jgi:hypothetical protein
MTPKEKARDLVKKYLFYFPEFRNEKEYDYNEDKAKECASIAVDEMIKQQQVQFENMVWSCVEYWQEVKQEIEKL